MIVFYRAPRSRFGDAVEEKLQDLVLAHRVVTVENGTASAELPSGIRPPALTEGRRVYTGEADINRFLDELAREVLYGRQFQSDACYLDPDHPDRCL